MTEPANQTDGPSLLPRRRRPQPRQAETQEAGCRAELARREKREAGLVGLGRGFSETPCTGVELALRGEDPAYRGNAELRASASAGR